MLSANWAVIRLPSVPYSSKLFGDGSLLGAVEDAFM